MNPDPIVSNVSPKHETMLKRPCPICDKDFSPVSIRHKFCSAYCRLKNFRKADKQTDWFYPIYLQAQKSTPTLDVKSKILQLLDKIKAGMVK